MTPSAPAPGDFVVEYRHLSRGRPAARVAIVHLTPDAGPEELCSSYAVHAGERAERLAAQWAVQDGTRAWRVVRRDGGDTRPELLDRRPRTPDVDASAP